MLFEFSGELNELCEYLDDFFEFINEDTEQYYLKAVYKMFNRENIIVLYDETIKRFIEFSHYRAYIQQRLRNNDSLISTCDLVKCLTFYGRMETIMGYILRVLTRYFERNIDIEIENDPLLQEYVQAMIEQEEHLRDEETEMFFDEQDRIREIEYKRRIHGHQKDIERRQHKNMLSYGQTQYSYRVRPKNVRTRQEKKKEVIEQERMINH